MKCMLNFAACLLCTLVAVTFFSCNDNSGPSKELISNIKLKTGPVISCGPSGNQFGVVDFETSCGENEKKDFNTAIALLHSFEYDDAEKVFAKIIDGNKKCAMAYWGVAMCNFHALWTPPAEPELVKGNKVIEIAKTITGISKRETDYINAIAVFYKDWKKIAHHTRCISYEKAMEKLYTDYPADREAAVFYALALDAAAEPTDKSFAKQKKAGAILHALYPSQPNHPGIIHYIIHTYDYPGLADTALAAAREYAKVAPSSAHALHMPSHIFTRLGLWDECIQSNLASVASAKCYAEQAGMKAHWDEELHGLDYLVYAYLQKGNNALAEEQLKYLHSIKQVSPVNFKVAYAYAAIPARICLENKNWKEAANLQLYPTDFAWTKFPWQEAIVHFAKLLGAVHITNAALANAELAKLQQLHDTLAQQKDAYKANQVAIQIKTGEAWIKYMAGKKTEAVDEMEQAVAMENATEKHPVTPGEVLPARELLADMLFEEKQYDIALLQYQAVLRNSPNRFNGLYKAGLAAEKTGNTKEAVAYYRQLTSIAANSSRPELDAIKRFLARH